ncbi:MAG: PKD domain-containing protein [Deltaproteobacteria bacterium]|nr:PKD domain-containing protein [Deltaproteobacteria bacterium]
MREAILTTANSNKSDWDPEIGWGEIDAKAAMDFFISLVPNEPPVAVAAADETSGRAPLTVTLSGLGSHDPDNNIKSYSWSLPDLAVVPGATVEYTFKEGGDFEVYLTVTDKFGASDTDSVVVSIDPPKDDSDEDDDGGCGCAIAGREASDGDGVISTALILGAFFGMLATFRRRKTGQPAPRRPATRV